MSKLQNCGYSLDSFVKASSGNAGMQAVSSEQGVEFGEWGAGILFFF